jgi:hypothetical protein
MVEIIRVTAFCRQAGLSGTGWAADDVVAGYGNE